MSTVSSASNQAHLFRLVTLKDNITIDQGLRTQMRGKLNGCVA